MAGPQAALLPETQADRQRLHLQHGPIDLIVEADGEAGEVRAAYRQARARFETILDELVAELPALRRAATREAGAFSGSTARRMLAAVRPHAGGTFVTPMAAVAGAVADEILAAMRAGRRLGRAYVNNGGDIALHLGAGAGFTVGLVRRPDAPQIGGLVRLSAGDGIGGVATSGRHGRSLSLGIADSVTVLAATAAAADAAATLIANAVDLQGHPAVRRQPANGIDPDSDLGGRPVVVEVGGLSGDEIDRALAAGVRCAETMRRGGLIAGAALFLQGGQRFAGAMPERIANPEIRGPLPAA